MIGLTPTFFMYNLLLWSGTTRSEATSSILSNMIPPPPPFTAASPGDCHVLLFFFVRLGCRGGKKRKQKIVNFLTSNSSCYWDMEELLFRQPQTLLRVKTEVDMVLRTMITAIDRNAKHKARPQ